jgi:Flp pilus assembly protein TadD
MGRRSVILLAILLGASLITGWLLFEPGGALFRLFSGEISDPKAKIIIGPYPTARDFRILKQNGVTTIISLLDPALPYESVLLKRERDLAERYRMKFYSYPMSSVLGIGFGARYKQHARDAAAAAMREPGKVYLHCYLGLHRVKAVQEIVASSGASYDHYRLREPEREASLRLIDSAQASFDASHYEQVLTQLKSLKQQTPQVTMLEGWSLYRLGRIADADDAFHQALRQSSNAWDARSGLGYCALNKNRLVEAEEEFSESLRQNPNDPEALIGLGIVRHREGRDTDAVNYLKKGLASGPPNPEAEDILRKVMSRQSVSRPPAGAGRDTSGPANHLKAGARTEPQAGP